MNDELIKDDEALRESAFTAQEIKVGDLILRPMTAGSFMQCRKAGIFDSEDTLFWLSGYLYIHAADKKEIAFAVQDKNRFEAAIYAFADTQFKHHSDIMELSEPVDAALKAYSAARSKPVYPSPESSESGNG